MKVELRAGKIVGIEADHKNLATGEGLCLKGLSYIERASASDRLLHPMIKRKDGTFQNASWDETLELIVTRLGNIRDRWGAQSVMYYAGSGTKGLLNSVSIEFWRLFGGCTTTYGDLCWPAGLEATRLTLGANKHNDPWDLCNARLIIIWGKNPAETNIHQMKFIDQARENGATIVVIDPRRTETAEGADLLVQIKPGTDGALALGIAKLLIDGGNVDHDFIKAHVAGFEEFAAAAAAFDIDRVVEITEVPAEAIRLLADLIGRIKPMTLCAGFGMQRYSNSGQSMRALISLLAITGNIGEAGAGWVYANLQSHVFDRVQDPLALYPPAPSDDPVRISLSTARIGRAMLAEVDPPLRAAWVERGNPITQNPETSKVLKAFRALDFVVVVDQFLTDTAREADVVLPAKTLFEQSDVINAYWHSYIQFKQKLVDPPGEVRPETEVYFELARSFGLEKLWRERGLPGQGDQEIEAYLERRLAAVEGIEGIDLEALRRGPVLAPNHESIAFADHIFPTRSGKIELVSGEAEERWGVARTANYTPLAEAATATSSYPLHLLTPNTKNRIHSQFNNLPSIKVLSPTTKIHLNPDDAVKRGIEPGMTVKVFNKRGEVTIEAAFDHSLRPGCVWITNGWWITDGGGVNFLSDSRETDMGHGAAFHDNFVEVRR